MRDLNFDLFSESLNLSPIGSGNGDAMIPEISSGMDTAQVNATNPPRELPIITILFEFIGLMISVIKSVT